MIRLSIRRPVAVLAIWIPPLLVACDRADLDGYAAEGVARWSVGDEPVLTVGSEDDPAYALFRVRQVRTLSSGAVAAISGDEVRVFGEDGEHLRTLGGPGRGPGEFSQLWSIHPLPGDSLVAFNSYPPRGEVFAPDGRLSRSIEFEEQAFYLERIEGGSWIASQLSRGAPPAVPGHFRDSVRVIRFSPDGRVEDTLATLARARFYGTAASYRGAPFSPTALVAAGRDHVFTAEGDSYRIDVRSADDGAVLSSIERDLPTRPVDDRMRQAYLDDLEAARRGRPPEAGAASRLDELPFPEHLPALGRLLVDREGWLWVRRYALDDEPREWDVYADGGLVASLTVPAELRVTEVGRDYVLGVWTDEMDAQTVRMYALVR